MIDGGAKGNFVSEKICKTVQLQINKNDIRKLTVADGRRHLSYKIPGCPLKINTYTDKIDFYSAPIIYDAILGKPWLAKYNPYINWQTNEIKFTIKDEKKHHWIAYEKS